LRFSDAQRIIHLKIDQAEDGSGFLEGVQDGTKTGNTVRKRNEFLPVAVPLTGLTSNQWAHIFISDLGRAGLLTEEGAVVHPALFTCPGDTVIFTDKPLDSEQAKVWLQDLLISAGMSVSFCRSLGTHSMKSTTLSWCAKFGLSARTRKFLGYHVDRSDTSLAIYSRDLASKPLRELCNVLKSVADRTFFPDSTRSGYFIRTRATELLEEPTDVCWFDSEVVHEPDVDFPENLGSDYSQMPPIPPAPDELSVHMRAPLERESIDDHHVEQSDILPEAGKSAVSQSDESQSESSFSNSSSSSGNTDNERVVENFELEVSRVVPRNPARSATEIVYQHVKLGTLHLTHSIEVSRLACGRALSLAYKPVHSLSFDWPKCRVCYGASPVD
jgi:hypothetical protein